MQNVKGWLVADAIVICVGLAYSVTHDNGALSSIIVLLVCLFLIPLVGAGVEYYRKQRKAR